MGGTNPSVTTIKSTLTWLTDLTGWRDPVRDGITSLDQWVVLPPTSGGLVYYTSNGPKNVLKAKDDPIAAANLIDGAGAALNANFYHGGATGSRFNWVGGW